MTAADPPRLVAVDMDGTFLRDDKTYDRVRFGRVHAAMDAAGSRLVVASGNQFEQLAGFFPEDADRLAFVAENGSIVVDAGEVVAVTRLPHDDAAAVARILDDLGLDYVASGPQGAVLPPGVGEAFAAEAAFYYPRLRRGTVAEASEPLFKFCIDHPSGVADELLADLAGRLAPRLVPTSSGHTSIDLVVPGTHKARGLQLLADRWGVAPAEAVAFGDGGNDVEMLRWAGRSFAMAGAPGAVRVAARDVAPGNDVDGVLQVLERWFG